MHTVAFVLQCLIAATLSVRVVPSRKGFGTALSIPSFMVNLDLPPEERWTEVVRYYREEALAMVRSLRPVLFKHLGESYDEWLKNVDFDPEYEAEMKGMVKIMNHPDIQLDHLKLMSMLYEMASPTACSGVLWATHIGAVMHGRNMDYAFHFNMPDGRILNWPDVTFEVTFYRGGLPLMKTTSWPLGVGIHTGMRFGGWSFEQNTRSHLNEWHANLEAAKQGGQIFGLAVRRIMETTPDFKTAVEKVYAVKYMAPMYFIMSGSGAYEGAVLTIDRLGRHESDTPAIQHLDNTGSAWHLVQTNDDLLKSAEDSRRPQANLKLQKMAQAEVSEDNLLRFMQTPPLFTPSTVFTTVMAPSSGYFRTVLPNEPLRVAANMSIATILASLQPIPSTIRSISINLGPLQP